MAIEFFDNAGLFDRWRRLENSFDNVSYVFDEAHSQLGERLAIIKRDFKSILLLREPGRGEALERQLRNQCANADIDVASPFKPWSGRNYDLIVTDLILHWVNDLQAVLTQCRHSLVPDGLFLGCLLGGQTLTELRDSFLQAELFVEKGATPRVIPMAQLVDMAAMMQKVGFTLPVVDRDELIISYITPLTLIKELRYMGEANRLKDRRKSFTKRRTFDKMVEFYKKNYNIDQIKVRATFESFFLTGWAPSQSQQQPLKRGSAQSSLKKVLEDKS